ncbi:hypothetical protein [Buttiauxella noackiae]|uniref:hypothetical protein n=1 Tax=Buttiauxella noackiae TaxID=82992 RepID=UPI000A3F23AB|nr:hypothetical protein [Buttiauxella noackiae]
MNEKINHMILNRKSITERQNQETLPDMSHLADFIEEMPLNKNLSLIVQFNAGI